MKIIRGERPFHLIGGILEVDFDDRALLRAPAECGITPYLRRTK